MIGLLYGEKNDYNTLSHFHRIPERDGRTDRQNCYINIVHQCAIKTESKLIFGLLHTAGCCLSVWLSSQVAGVSCCI